jgi:hypothetical protein
MLRPGAAAWLLFVLALSGCGVDSRTPTAPDFNISGQWQGTIESPEDGPGTVTLQLTQTGLSVTGSLHLSQNNVVDVPATLTGTLAGASFPTTMRYTVTYEFGPFNCQGTFSGTSNVTILEIGGVFSGQNCVRMFTGTLSATRRN